MSCFLSRRTTSVRIHEVLPPQFYVNARTPQGSIPVTIIFFLIIDDFVTSAFHSLHCFADEASFLTLMLVKPLPESIAIVLFSVHRLLLSSGESLFRTPPTMSVLALLSITIRQCTYFNPWIILTTFPLLVSLCDNSYLSWRAKSWLSVPSQTVFSHPSTFFCTKPKSTWQW